MTVSITSPPGIAAEAAGLPFLDVTRAEFQRDPYGLLDRLREQSWLVRSPLGFTIIGYPEAREIKRPPHIVRVFDAVDPGRSPLLHQKAAENISSQSGARLVKLRKIIVQALRQIYVAGGQTQDLWFNGVFAAFEAYDPATNSWALLPPVNIPRHGLN